MGIICASGGQCLNAGYLTVEKVVDPLLGKYILRIPNKEIVSEFSSLTEHYLQTDKTSLDILLDQFLQMN